MSSIINIQTWSSDVVGPYPGRFYTAQEFKRVMVDSGNAWEIRNPKGSGVQGYVDPGSVPSSNSDLWMAKVNCTTELASQNLVGFQYKKEIYNRAIKVRIRFF